MAQARPLQARPSRRLHTVSLAVLAAILSGAAACAEGDSAAATPGSAAFDGPDAPLTLATRDIARVGALEGAEWETFSRISDVGFDAAGNLYVFDPENHRVVVTDSAGNHLRTMGREGDGPGELRQPFGFAVGSDGTTVVFDISSQSMVVFGPDGEFVRQVRYEGDYGLPTGGLMLRDGGDVIASGQGMIIRMNTSGDEGAEGPREPETIPVRSISTETGTDTVLHRAWMPPPTEQQDSEEMESEGGGRLRIAMNRLEAFRPSTQVAVLPDGGLAVSDSVDWAIDVLAPDGSPRQVLRRPVQPVVVTDEIRDAERARRIREAEEQGGGTIVFGGGGGMSGMQEQIRRMRMQQIETMTFADAVPVVTRVEADREGRLWVERSGAMPGDEGPIDIVDAEGTYFGTIGPDGVRIPDAFGPDGLAAYIETDAFDVPHVVVRRIEWPAP